MQRRDAASGGHNDTAHHKFLHLTVIKLEVCDVGNIFGFWTRSVPTHDFSPEIGITLGSRRVTVQTMDIFPF